jgi:uncharacterized protein (UPF0548 family)
MLLPSRPDRSRIEAFLGGQGEAPFSYPEVGATKALPPPGYAIDRYRLRLGSGERTFERRLQARFIRDSNAAIARAVSAPP